MYLNDYQQTAMEFAMFEERFYPAASLMVEAAELADLFVKPWLRGDDKEISRAEVISEAGDVLWNLAVLLCNQDISLNEVAVANIHKLQDRLERGVIQGDGGSR